MAANNRQIGGDHYRNAYQHWDFVCDVRMHYLPACASKYVSRWREKDGLNDLEKAIHYIEKAKERGVAPCTTTAFFGRTFFRFAVSQNLTVREAAAVWFMADAKWDLAKSQVEDIITQYESSQPQPI